MKLNVEAEVGIEDISRAIITELNSSEADEVTGAADELLDSSAGNQFVRIYDALAHQLHCEWDPEIPGCVTEARLELVRAAQEIINSEASLQEIFEIQDEEAETDAEEDENEFSDVERIQRRIERRLGNSRGRSQLNEEGILSLSGYSVGNRSGLTTGERRDCIRAAFSVQLPRTLSRETYGGPQSEQRKQHLQSVLRFLVSNAERRQEQLGHDMSRAISEWSQDLGWIRDFI